MKIRYELPVIGVRDTGNGTVQYSNGQFWSDPVPRKDFEAGRAALAKEAGHG